LAPKWSQTQQKSYTPHNKYLKVSKAQCFIKTRSS